MIRLSWSYMTNEITRSANKRKQERCERNFGTFSASFSEQTASVRTPRARPPSHPAPASAAMKGREGKRYVGSTAKGRASLARKTGLPRRSDARRARRALASARRASAYPGYARYQRMPAKARPKFSAKTGTALFFSFLFSFLRGPL